MNRLSCESHQTCLNGRVAREEEQSSTDQLWEFDRIRTCVNKSHNLAPKPLGHKLHINSRWIRTTTSRIGIWYATITPWSCFLVAPEGVEPSLTEPKPVVLPLYHRAVLRSGGRTRTYGVKDSGFTVHPRCRWSTPDYMVGPHGIEPPSLDFQSSAYTKSAKAPFAVAPDGFEPPLADPESAVLTVTP